MIVLLLAVSLVAGAEEKSVKCDASPEAFKKITDEARAAYPNVSVQCSVYGEGIGKSCAMPNEKYCRDFRGDDKLKAVGELKSSGMSKQTNEASRKLLRSANCFRGSSQCISRNSKWLEKKCESEDDKKYHEMIKQKLRGLPECLKEQGEPLEKQARELHTTAESLQDQDGKSGDIVCYEEKGTRICDLTAEGESMKQVDQWDRDEMKKTGDTPVSINYNCSGTLLKDGRTVATAGHCTDDIEGAKDGNYIQVTDADGETHLTKGRCAQGVKNFGEGDRSDLSLCQLGETYKSNDNYLLVRDNSLSQCTESGYEYRCADSKISGISGSRAQQSGYSTNEQDKLMVYRSTGYVRYDETTGLLYTSAPSKAGMSGSGIMVNMDGRQVIAAGTSIGSTEMSPLGSASPVATADQLARTRAQLNPEMINQGLPLMRELSQNQKTR